MKEHSTFRLLIVLICFVFWSPETTGQTINLDEIKPPSSPGFMIINVAPTAIEKPSNPKDLGASLFSGTDNFSIIPENYAVEFSPYWLGEHAPIDYKEYFNLNEGIDGKKANKSNNGLYRNLAFSLATTSNRILNDSVTLGPSLGAGFRTMLVEGKANPKLTKKLEGLRNQQNSLLDLDDDIDDANEYLDDVTQSISELERSLAGLNGVELNTANEKLETAKLNLESAKMKVKEAEEKYGIAKNEVQTTALEIQELNRNRVGHQLSLSAAAAWDFSSNSSDSQDFQRLGIWMTYSYTPLGEKNENASNLDLMLLARYMYSDTVTFKKSNLDFGGKIAWSFSNKAKISGELLGKVEFEKIEIDNNDVSSALTADFSDELAYRFNLEYAISEKNLLIVSLGKNIEVAGLESSNDVRLNVGINLGLSNNPNLKIR